MHALQAADLDADARGPIDLESLERMACGANPTLVQARAQVEVTFGAAIQAGLWPNPTISYLGLIIGNAGTAGSFQGAVVSQPIITAGKRRLDRARFLETTKAAQWDAMAVEYRVLNDVRIHDFRTLGLQALVEVQKELLQNAEDMVVTVREGYNLGVHDRRELHDADAALQVARLSYLRAQNMYRQGWIQLTATVGEPMPFTRLAGGLEGDATPIEYDGALNRILQESPKIQTTYANLRSEQINLKLQRVMPWPNLVAVAGPGYHFSSERVGAFTQLHVQSVPVWNWNQGNIRATNAQVTRQEAEIRRVSSRLQSDLAMIYQEYLTALQNVESYQRVILPELRRAYELTLDSYEDDRGTWGDVLMAQRMYYMNRAAYVTHLFAWREAEVLIVGYLLHGGLMPAPMPMPPQMMPAMGPHIQGQEMFATPSVLAPPP